MRKATIFLMALALALAAAAPLPLPLRRSRFLANAKFPPQPPPQSLYKTCTKKDESIVCRQPGSPGATCCNGACVDTEHSFQHCGNCNKACKYSQTCCEGKCVNTFTNHNNCGGCGVRCRTKCTNGYCDYAA